MTMLTGHGAPRLIPLTFTDGRPHYVPDGTGHCALCRRDVGAHDAGHEPHLSFSHYDGPADSVICVKCGKHKNHPIHDVGRTLLCPKGER